MSNLVKELGDRYFKQRFVHAMFAVDGMPHFLDSESMWPNGKVTAVKVLGPAEKPKTESVNLPWHFFDSFDKFRVPPLGWRMAAQGRVLIHFTRNGIRRAGYRRGVAPENLRKYYAPSSIFLDRGGNISLHYYNGTAATTSLIMDPKYMSLKEGIEAMDNGDVVGFAANANIAVIPAVSRGKTVMFNTNFVGTISKDGEVKCESPIIESILKDGLK
jgi:hypothetical protein